MRKQISNKQVLSAMMLDQTIVEAANQEAIVDNVVAWVNSVA